ncbi:LysR family transcriptional regulator [Rhizobium anhuiense]|uniref:LysR substrate-binding domain-containing protein n=1 Tax=Rhizobium anhuiense TaxID=1184720 RepID=UPI000BE9F78C|nr:LysR family transcriptional regulator [Rhizobium anhuiense]PDS35049.1 LysR family transcriptional regulator [Rhizobium anhuiense]
MRLLISRHLENFLALYEARNMHLAADRKGISQPALTKSLKLLEEELGAELFIRTHRGLEPTDAGDALYQHACAIEQSARFASLDIGDIHANLGGRIRIGVGPVLAVSTFPAALADFHRQLPTIRISVETAISTHLFNALVNNDVDIVVAALPEMPLPERFTAVKLLTTNMVAICRQGHPILSLKRIDRETLTRFGRVGFVEDRDFEKKAQRVFGVSSERLRPVIETTSLSIMFGILATTDYYAIVSEMIVTRARRDELASFLPDGGLWPLDIDLMCKSSLINSRPISLLRHSLVAVSAQLGSFAAI